MVKKKEEQSMQVSFNQNTGEINAERLSGKTLDMLVDNGLAISTHFDGKHIYFINPYLMYTEDWMPNDTLLRMFEGEYYCRRCTCKYYTDFKKRKDFCDKCRYRIAVNKEEYCKEEFKDRIYNENITDYFEIEESLKNEYEEERMPYRKYLKTDYWQAFRQEALEHHGNKCSWCGASGDDVVLNVHHIRYGEWFNEDLENVTLLCAECHSKAHGKAKYNQDKL